MGGIFKSLLSLFHCEFKSPSVLLTSFFNESGHLFLGFVSLCVQLKSFFHEFCNLFGHGLTCIITWVIVFLVLLFENSEISVHSGDVSVVLVNLIFVVPDLSVSFLVGFLSFGGHSFRLGGLFSLGLSGILFIVPSLGVFHPGSLLFGSFDGLLGALVVLTPELQVCLSVLKALPGLDFLEQLVVESLLFIVVPLGLFPLFVVPSLEIGFFLSDSLFFGLFPFSLKSVPFGFKVVHFSFDLSECSLSRG